ncbi:MAG: SusE domain-containing protein [Prevotella sp.]|nr:SusE domain-containing protein [Prevotella sp.]
MKKITYLMAALLCGMVALTACDDDRDSNPTVKQPESFVLNEPALSGNVYDLANSTSLTVTCQQPDYGYTALVTYYAQVSLDDTWVDAETEDDTASYIELDESWTVCKLDLDAEAIDRAILKIGAYESEDEFPTQPMTIYIRLRATLTSGYECYSNTIALNVKAYYADFSDAEPELWYITGDAVADGSWGSEVGVSCVPMSFVNGYEYDSNGKGEITYTAYFDSSKGFKLVKVPGNWDDQWGSTDGGLTPVMNDGGSQNFYVPSSGYYTVTLNTRTDVLTIEATDTPTEYGQMLISGSINDWATDVPMSSVNTCNDVSVEHLWTYEVTSDGSAEVKFLIDSSWSPNWGAADFPYGFGVNNGDNIPVAAGTYRVVFNDITGFYYFFEE